jgi:biotin carboxyl carrier protein
VAEGEERAVELSEADAPAPGVAPAHASGQGAPAFVATEDGVHVDVDGRSVEIRVAPPPDVDRAAREAARHAGHGGMTDVTAPMPGSVLAVHAAAGSVVDAGDPIITLEAMKMEHVVTAPAGGDVRYIAVRPGDQVVRGQVIAVIGQ